MKKDFSPEEKLLRLIKGSGRKDAPKENADARIAAPSYYKGSSIQAAKLVSAPFPFKIKDINTRNINPVLILILIGLLLYFMVDVIFNPYSRKDIDVIAREEQEPVEAKEKAAPAVEPYSYYSSQIGDRNIFSPQEGEAAMVPSGPSVEEISTNLSLVGIIAGDKPQAIIEDKKAGKSYFLYKGGLVGQAKVLDILDDKVLMEYNGQPFELVL